MNKINHSCNRILSAPVKSRGFGLVELMVSITIGLLIVSALLTLFINTSRTNAEMTKANNLIENGRFAIQLIENDVVHSGFWGAYVPDFDDLSSKNKPENTPTLVPDPCRDFSEWNDVYKNSLVGIPIQAYEIPTPVPSPTLSVCASNIEKPVANTDVLVVRHAETCLPGVGNCEAESAGDVYFQPSLCTSDSSSYYLGTAGFTLLQRDCATLAEKRKFISNIYYIRNYASNPDDGIPTLVRSNFDGTEHHAATPLIEGIESFHVEFGIDNLSKTGDPVDYSSAVSWKDPNTKKIPTNRGDGIPDEFTYCTVSSPCTVDELMNITAVKLHVLSRNRESTPGYKDVKEYMLGEKKLGPFNDGYKRHVFSTTIRLPNIAGRRETP